MIDTNQLDALFRQFLVASPKLESLRETRAAFTRSDVGPLLEFVASLDDPSRYCSSDLDEQTPAGYFLFIDFVSALIIDLGAEAVSEVERHAAAQQPFVKWIVKFVSDARFHGEIMAKFQEVFD